MIVLGMGHDMIDINRIEATLERFGDRYTNRIFTEIERKKSDRRLKRAASYAKRFAAKEACSKALGTGFRKSVYWRDLEVVNLPGGKPTMQLHNGAGRRLAEMTPEGFMAQIALTITDDDPWAQAHVLITAVPQELAVRAGLISPS